MMQQTKKLDGAQIERADTMTGNGYDAESWAGELTRAITRLVEIQNSYSLERHAEGQRRARSDGDRAGESVWAHPVHDLASFYWRARSDNSRFFEEHYRPIREALEKARGILSAHPTLADVSGSTAAKGRPLIRVLSRGGAVDLTNIVAGIVARGAQRGVGYKVAVAELWMLLDADINRPDDWPREDLSSGFHVVLFHGLRVRDAIQVGDLRIMAVDHLEPYLAKGQLREHVLGGLPGSRWPSVGAVVKPLRWKPKFVPADGDLSRLEALDWGGSFFEDAEELIQLLAVTHAAPVVCLAKIDYCTHRDAAHLLGLPHYHTGFDRGRAAGSFDRNLGCRDVDTEAVARASTAFGHRSGQVYKDCAPVLRRLAEALARSGQFRRDDRILDVAIALERLYELGHVEISYKLKTRAACFLAADTAGRSQVFNDVKEFYDLRSSIIHKGRASQAPSKNDEVFAKGLDVAWRTIDRFLRDGPPDNWNDVVIAGTDGGGGLSRPK